MLVLNDNLRWTRLGGRQVSGSVTGNKNGAKDNLRAESFGDFATHLATVAARWEYSNVSWEGGGTAAGRRVGPGPWRLL